MPRMTDDNDNDNDGGKIIYNNQTVYGRGRGMTVAATDDDDETTTITTKTTIKQWMGERGRRMTVAATSIRQQQQQRRGWRTGWAGGGWHCESGQGGNDGDGNVVDRLKC